MTATHDTQKCDNNYNHYGPPLLGGEYCGLSATFDSKTGKLVPIPERLVPESLLAWGQVPTALEVLVTEDVRDVRLREWCRTTRTILPATDCGVDNLQTINEELETESYRIMWNDDDTVAHQFLYPINDNHEEWRLETIFGMNTTPQQQHRVRLSIDLTEQLEVSSPIAVHWERQIGTEPTADNDKEILDAATIYTLLGTTLRNSYSFAITTPAQATTTTKHRIFIPPNLTLSTQWIDSTDDGKNRQRVIEVGQIRKEEHTHYIVRRTFSSSSIHEDGSAETLSESLDLIDWKG